MRYFIVVNLLVSLLLGGCKTTKENDGNGESQPIVSPTVITNEVQDATDPVLPPYMPWWVEE